ncbi:MAG: hypothetical protein GXP29_01825 [Planctomycetes bacterium]|nr:hypothetical protein [Planctomycetota bacterium]
MKAPLETRKPTPNEVLEILKHEHALLVECEEADPLEINFDTRICDWFYVSDVDFRTLRLNATRLNRIFELGVSFGEWKSILKPSRTKTLGDICEFVARRANVLHLPEPKILGRPCRTAGAFLTIRELMRQADVDTTALKPSSPLAEYSATGIPEISSSIILAAPGLMHRIRHFYPSDAMYFILGFVLFHATLATGILALGFAIACLPLALFCFGSFLYVWRRSVNRRQELTRVEFEGMHDFKDLCRAMANVSPPPWKDGAPVDGR